MMRKVIFVGLAMVTLSIPAFAADEFYVAKDAATKKCMVVDKKPDGTAAMMVGKDMYKSKADAEAAMKTAAECK